MFPSSSRPPPKPFHARGSSSFARDPSSDSPMAPSPPQLPVPASSTPPPPPPVAYYRPSIYTYTCRGAWFVSSSDQYSEGKCRGIQSRLELLADLDDSTRDVAIKNFTFMTDYELDEGDPDPHHAGSTSGAPGGNGLNQKTKSILISPALIYKEKIESSTTDNATHSSPNQPHNKASRQAIEIPAPASSALPEEELIKKQRWSCYGSTEVELLVLQNLATGNEHIAAVAPRNVGVSVRKIDADDGSITSIGIGWLNIVVDAGPSFLDDDDEEEEDDAHDRASSQHSQRSNPLDRQQLQPSASGNAKGVPASSSQTPEEVPPRPSQDSIARARTQLRKYYEFAGKVGEQMKANVNFLKDTAQDDFVRRSVAAGTRIVDNIPRTIDRTASFMQKMLDRWAGGGGGGGPDDAGGDSGPGGHGPGP